MYFAIVFLHHLGLPLLANSCKGRKIFFFKKIIFLFFFWGGGACLSFCFLGVFSVVFGGLLEFFLFRGFGCNCSCLNLIILMAFSLHPLLM